MCFFNVKKIARNHTQTLFRRKSGRLFPCLCKINFWVLKFPGMFKKINVNPKTGKLPRQLVLSVFKTVRN